MVQILMQILIVKVSSVCIFGFKLRLQVRRKASMVVRSCSHGTSYSRSIPGGHKPDVAQAHVPYPAICEINHVISHQGILASIALVI